MARQRFIWPTLWDDPALGRLDAGTRLLYIACFSLADDEGRLVGDPVFLKGAAFRYANISSGKVKAMRDKLAEVCSSFCVYNDRGHDYIAFLNWGEFQKPKYPKPSQLPPPPGNPSGSVPETLGERSSLGRDGLGRDGMDRDGMDRDGQGLDMPAEIEYGGILKEVDAA